MGAEHEPGHQGGPTFRTPPREARTAIIIHNFKRPQNLLRIVAGCLRAERRPDVFVIDNSSDDSLAAPLRAAAAKLPGGSARLIYRANLSNRGAGDRYSVASRLDHDAVASIDDDLFLTPMQVDALLGFYLHDRSRVHGVWGERFTIRDGRPFMVNAIVGREIEVDILNRAYAFGPGQARIACRLLQDLGYQDWLSLGPGSDIILSFSGERRPMVHDVGPLESCKTAGAPGIAVWRRDDFRSRRFALLYRLMQIRRRRAT